MHPHGPWDMREHPFLEARINFRRLSINISVSYKYSRLPDMEGTTEAHLGAIPRWCTDELRDLDSGIFDKFGNKLSPERELISKKARAMRRNSRRRPISNNSHPLPLQLHTMLPLRRMKPLALERVHALHVFRKSWLLEDANRADDYLCVYHPLHHLLSCGCGCGEPDVINLLYRIPFSPYDARVEQDVRPEVVLVGELEPVSVQLWLRRQGLIPVRAQLSGEAIEMHLDVGACAWIRVGPPRTANLRCLFDDLRRPRQNASGSPEPDKDVTITLTSTFSKLNLFLIAIAALSPPSLDYD